MQKFQTNRDKLSMIREGAAERANPIECAMCNARCVKFYYIWCDAKSHRYKYKCEHDFTQFCPFALAMWIISSLMMAIKNLYVHTNHLTDQPSVDCMHFVLLLFTTAFILNAKPTGNTVCEWVCVRLLVTTRNDNSKTTQCRHDC